jgi:hypothetical protein
VTVPPRIFTRMSVFLLHVCHIDLLSCDACIDCLLRHSRRTTVIADDDDAIVRSGSQISER